MKVRKNRKRKLVITCVILFYWSSITRVLKFSGNITCVATNVAGSSKYTFVIDVFSPPIFNETAMNKTENTVLTGSNVTLICPFEGIPTPEVRARVILSIENCENHFSNVYFVIVLQIEWIQEDEVISTNPILFIESIDWSYNCNFECIATNQYGKMNFTTHLHVLSKIFDQRKLNRFDLIL